MPTTNIKNSPDSVTVTGTTETEIFSTTVYANDLDVYSALRVYMGGQFTQGAGSQQNFTFRLKYGGTTIVSFMQGIPSNAGDTGTFVLDAILQVDSAGNVWGTGGVTFNVSTDQRHKVNQGSAVVDTTIDQTLSVTVQLQSATNQSLTKKVAFVELVE